MIISHQDEEKGSQSKTLSIIAQNLDMEFIFIFVFFFSEDFVSLLHRSIALGTELFCN